jgi:hypothetical protein
MTGVLERTIPMAWREYSSIGLMKERMKREATEMVNIENPVKTFSVKRLEKWKINGVKGQYC